MTVKELKHMLENAQRRCCRRCAKQLGSGGIPEYLCSEDGACESKWQAHDAEMGRGERVYLRRACYVGNFIRLR